MTDTVDRPVAEAAAPSPVPVAAPSPAAESQLDVAELGELLLGRWADIRRRTRALLERPEFWRDDSLGQAEHRQRVFEQLDLLVKNGAVLRAFPKDLGGEDNPGGNIAAFEELVIADPSLQIKAGVQWGLFGAAILHLGTRKHHERLLPGVMSLEVPGAYAMTETGHGSDVQSIGTTATYIPETDEFEIHTPFRGAWKDYLGNAALHGKAAVVFAQLITRGVDHGVHAFYVPLRDEAGEYLPGVGGEDDGPKGGLNGIDNGRLHFTHVRIPRDNLLDRYGSVAEGGEYSSPIASPGRRFFTMLGTLVQGRVSLDGSAAVASRLALAIAIRYASERRQFDDGSGDGERVLLDYRLHQRRLLPRLAEAYALSFGHEQLLDRFHAVFSGAEDTDEKRQALEAHAAALKPFSTWSALDTLQTAREACGGAGYLAENRIVLLRADLDVYATFEGDNTVLLMLAGKRLLSDYARRLRAKGQGGAAAALAGRAVSGAVDRAGLRGLGQAIADLGSSSRAAASVLDAGAQHRLLAHRLDSIVAGLAARLRPASTLPPRQAAALVDANQGGLVDAALAYAELLEWEAFTAALGRIEDPATRETLTALRDLFGLSLVERHADWHLAHGRLSRRRARAVSAAIDERLLPQLRPHALALVEAFGYTQDHLRAAIASGAELERQEEARGHYALLAASGQAPVPEKASARD